MALIGNNLTAPERAAQNIRDLSTQLQNCLVAFHRQIFPELWHNPSATAQEILDVLGPDGLTLFVGGSKLVDLILTGNPAAMTPEEYLPKQEVQVTQEGTIYLVPLPEPEPEPEPEEEPEPEPGDE